MPRTPSPNHFFALRFNGTGVSRLQELQKAIQWPSGAFSLLPPESFHLTLRFIGPVVPESVPLLRQLLEKTTEKGIQLPALRVRGLLPLPSLAAGRVVAAAVDLDPALESLVEAFDRVLRATEQSESANTSFRFLPHITLARVNRAVELHPLKLRALLEPILASSFEPFSVQPSDIALLRTEREQGVTRYVPISSYPLT